MKSQVLHVPLYVNLTHWQLWQHRKQSHLFPNSFSLQTASEFRARETKSAKHHHASTSNQKTPLHGPAALTCCTFSWDRDTCSSHGDGHAATCQTSQTWYCKKKTQREMFFSRLMNKESQLGLSADSPPPQTVNTSFLLKCMDSSSSIQSSWSQPRWSPGRKHLHFQDHCRDQWRARLLSAEAQKKT